ncbi:DEKNAAC100546 [Brettanomyces naardenensis]|uniref:DEKNAAC100546 n=1 Tax=Brettanomyces naardenensis TaxID=13370 RepID=A0A448YGI8_BRENA|nr:DEKNAAC100546 [Brettanomyces naardenensis]
MASSTQNSAALAKVRELLKTEDDLDKVENFTRNLTKEKSTIDSQLKLEQERAMNGVQTMINNMQLANKHLKELEYSVQKLDVLQKDSTSDSEVSGVFDKAATVLKNFTDVEEIYNNFKTLTEKMDLIEGLMAMELPENSDYYSETSSGDNLLLIHYQLTSLRDFRDQISLINVRSSGDAQQVVERSFSRLDKLITHFDYILSLVIDAFVDIVGCENYGLIIKLVKVIQYEDNEDAKLQLLNGMLNLKDKSSAGTNGSRISEEINSAERLPSNVKRSGPRGYRKKFEQSFQNTIDESFKDLASGNDYSKLLQLLDENYYETLGVYNAAVARCFPPEWRFFEKILKWHQDSLGKIFVNMLEDKSIPNSAIVQVLNFEYENKKKLREMFDLKKDQVNKFVILTAEKKNDLLESCLQFNKKKTTEWIQNSLRSAVELFHARSKEPPDSKDEKLGIETAQIVVEILRSNIKALAELGDSKILVEYLKFFASDCMGYFYTTWKGALESDVKKWTLPSESGGEEDSTIGYMPRYITVLANDCVKLVDALDSQFNDSKKLLHTSFHEQITEISSQASGYAIELGTDCLKQLNGFIEVEYTPFLDEVFSKQWYKSSSMIEYSLQIVDESYMGPLEEFLHPELNISLFEIVFDQYLLSYLNALFKRHSIKEEKFASKIERDGNLIQQTFSRYADENVVTDQLYILDILIDLSSCSQAEEYIGQWKSAVEVFNDLPTDFLQIILENKEVRDSKVKTIVGQCKEISEELAVTGNQATTFMSNFHYRAKGKNSL